MKPLLTSAGPRHGNLQQTGMLLGSLAKGCTRSAAEGTQLLPHLGGYQRLRTMWEVVY